MISQNLKYLRKSINNLTQVQLAKSTGLSRGVLSAYEKGNAIPPIDNIIKICSYFGVTIDDFVLNKIISVYPKSIKTLKGEK